MAEKNSVEASQDNAFSQLLEAIWCPICGCKLSVETANGKRVLKCAKHGEMKCYLDHDPKVAVEEA